MDFDDDIYLSANDTSTSSDNDSFCSADGTLSDYLRQTLAHRSRLMFNVCHINAQSIPCHYNDLLEAFSDTNVHAILISESWLKPHLLSTSYSLPGYILLRNDRVGRRGGGVAIYLRSTFPYKILVSSTSTSSPAEYLFLEVDVQGAKTVLGVVYCPPTVDYFSSIELILESLGSEYAHHVIMGDFNTDLLSSHSSRSRKLLEIFESVSLHVLPLQPTHHNIDGDDTWLDIILTSAPTLASLYGQYPAPGFSRHDLIFLSYLLKPPKVKPKVLRMRCFGRMDVNKLSRDASQLNWDSMLAASSVDDKVNILNDNICKIYDIHAPLRKITVKRPPAPWITTGVRMAMRRRDRAFRRYKRDRCDDNWAIFKSARNRCNQMIRNAKRRHILNNIASSTPANIWMFLRTLGIGKHQHTDLQRTLCLDDINRHFTTSTPLDYQAKCQAIDHLTRLPCPEVESFKFSPVAEDEIKKIILSIKSNAVGCDNISRHMITTVLDPLLPAISHVINFSLTSGTFPSLWRKAHVIPLPKIHNPSLPNHFRPISILPFLSKVLETCTQKQLSRYVYQNNLLSPFQSGFRPGHSTTTALLKVTGDIRDGMENTRVTVLALVDFSNAFNTVSHDILLAILSHLMVSSEALDWFSNYLRGRQQSVRFGDSSSSWRDIDSGVPQGGILSPMLFSLFINLITQDLQCDYHLYADDLQIYTQASVDCVSTAIDKINKDLAAINNWSDRFGLSVNPTKCQAMIIGSQWSIRKLNMTILPPVVYNGININLCPSVKNLGLHIDTTLSWRAQVTHVSQKVTGTLRTLYRLKNFLPPKTKTMLVYALVFPLIDYGDVCYFDLNAELLDKLDRLLNNCIRFIFNLRKYDHVSTYRSQLNWLPIRLRRRLRALTTLYSILTSPSPPTYLTCYFQYLCSSHDRNLRSSNNLLLLCPPHSSGFIHSSFSIQAILLWNALPLEIRMATNRNAFKLKVKNLLLADLANVS